MNQKKTNTLILTLLDVRALVVSRWFILILLMLFAHREKQFQFKTDFVGMKFSFHAVNPAYSLIDDSQREFFSKSSEFIPERAPKVSLSIQKNAHLAIFSALSDKNLDSKSPVMQRAKPERIKVEPLVINVTETVANEKFLFRFARISAKQIKVTEIVALQKSRLLKWLCSRQSESLS